MNAASGLLARFARSNKQSNKPRAARASHLTSQVLPMYRHDLESAALRCRQLVRRRAMVSASAAVVPVPGFDLLVDFNVLSRLLHDINAEFGLTPAQLEHLSQQRRLSVYRAIDTLGTSAVGQLITRELLTLVIKGVARRVAIKRTARYLPIAGQAVAASLSYATVKLIGDRHIADCLRVASSAIEIKDIE